MPRRCANLHRRGEIYYFFWRDEQGRRREESLRTSDIEIAQQRYRLRTEEIRNGRSPNDLSSWTLQKAVTSWLEQRKLRVSPGTFKAECSITRNLVDVFGGGVTLRSLADIRQIRMYQDTRLKAGRSPKSVNNEMQVITSILNLAQLWTRVQPDYQRLRVMKSDLPDALTQEEATRLLTTAANSYPYAVAPYGSGVGFFHWNAKWGNKRDSSRRPPPRIDPSVSVCPASHE
jgi:hypothetical protein